MWTFKTILLSAGERFYPSGCGGHKNSGNVATFSEFLGGRKNLSPAHKSALVRSYLHRHWVGGKSCPRVFVSTWAFGGRKNLSPAHTGIARANQVLEVCAWRVCRGREAKSALAHKLLLAGTFTYTANKVLASC